MKNMLFVSVLQREKGGMAPATALVSAFLMGSASGQLLMSEPWGVSALRIEADETRALTIPLEPADPDFAALIGDQLAGSATTESGDKVFFWESLPQQYSLHQKLENTGDAFLEGLWLNAGGVSDKDVRVGESLFIRPEGERVLYLPGKLPLRARSEAQLPPGFELKGHPYLAPAPVRDARSEPIEYTRIDTGEPYTESTPASGEAWWRFGQENRVERFRRPYGNMYDTLPGSPSIEEVTISEAEGIGTFSGRAEPGQVLEIFCQDVPAESTPKSFGGWTLFGEVTADAAGFWSVALDLPGPGGELATCLVLSTVMQDSDGDGLSDAREVLAENSNPYSAVNETEANRGHMLEYLRRQREALAEARRQGRNAEVVYVDEKEGEDHLDGATASAAEKAWGHGPKKSMVAGAESVPQGTVELIVEEGRYEALPNNGERVEGDLIISPQGRVEVGPPRDPNWKAQRTNRRNYGGSPYVR